MSSHFETLGFRIESQDDLIRLIESVPSNVETFSVRGGKYTCWTGGSGIELWLAQDDRGELIGLNPTFRPEFAHLIGVTSALQRDDLSKLEGGFYAWAGVEDDPEKGLYPFFFDVPDFARYRDLRLPSRAEAHLTAFAEILEIHDTAEAFQASQTNEKKLATESFIPAGLFKSRDAGQVPDAEAILTGVVVASEARRNEITGATFHWLRLKSYGGTFDVVAAPTLGPLPKEGQVIKGSFWITGRPTRYEARGKGFLDRLLGR